MVSLGGARRNRTDDLFNAIEALSQLSYGPLFQNAARLLRLGRSAKSSRGRRYSRNPSPATRPTAKKDARQDASWRRRPTGQPSSSGAMSPSIRLVTSSSSSSPSSSKETSAAGSASSSTSRSSTKGSAALPSIASTSSSGNNPTPAGLESCPSSSSR